MNITKENFNQYVAIASRLADENLFTDARNVALDAFDAWQKMDVTDDDDIEAALALRILVFSDLRRPEPYTVLDNDDAIWLAECLNSCPYWSDSFIDGNKENYNGAFIQKEKSHAYGLLAAQWPEGRIHDYYLDRALDYNSLAIDSFSKLAETDDEAAAEARIDTMINRAKLLRLVSNNQARRYAISLFAEKLSDEQRADVMEIYQQATDVLFDDFFAKKAIMTVQSVEDAGEDVKNDVIDAFLDWYAEPGNDDRLWWLFTHKNAPEDRKMILFVENIEDAGTNDFDLIPWVFTLDRYPSDIEFNEGEEPVDGAIYEIDPENTDRYIRIR